MKTAIIVRGNARTWNYVKHHNIEFFNTLYNYPDWYVAFPDTGTVTRESLIEDFQGSNVKSIQLISDDCYPFDRVIVGEQIKYYNSVSRTPSYWRQAWLDYAAGIEKRRYELENNIRYTNVLGFRPDNWFVADPKVTDYKNLQIELPPMTISNTDFSGTTAFNDWVTPDFIWRAGSSAADLYCMRFLDSNFTDTIPNQLVHPGEHTLPCYYQARNFIDGRRIVGHIQAQIITPNATFPWTTDSYRDNFYKVQWHELSIEERRELCINLKISLKDYQLE